MIIIYIYLIFEFILIIDCYCVLQASKLESEKILEPFTKSAKEGEQKLKAKPVRFV